MSKLSSSAQRVQDALDKLGLVLKVVELPDSTRTAADAAKAIGCTVAQIAKSLIFRVHNSDCPVLVIASGVNRVNESTIATQLGEKIGKADADYVRRRTGFVIGGVPPVGHVETLETFLDEDLLQYDEIWAAAGTPHAVFRLSPNELLRATAGKVISIQ
ncbi:MAG: YbaK/EbsC family protein [Anaerolineales bacterium]|nr:YbaK/EbsC family protein [Chloroflexota bacterium]MBL6981748.1 YbaK/EbsC family protein [Anaerolineales bacterium]